MGGGDLNMKKSWHPLLLKNQERVWLEEKKALEEKKKLDQLRKEKEEERQLQELQRLQEEQTGKKRTEKLEWMYSTPATGNSTNPNDLEDYLLGKKRVDKMLTADDNEKLGAAHKNFIAVQNANSVRDIASKIREDPLLAIKQQEQAAYQSLLTNPLRLKKMREELGIKPKKDKKEKKREKEERKRLKQERKHQRDRSRDIPRDSRTPPSDSRRSHRDRSPAPEHRRNRRSRSPDDRPYSRSSSPPRRSNEGHRLPRRRTPDSDRDSRSPRRDNGYTDRNLPHQYRPDRHEESRSDYPPRLVEHGKRSRSRSPRRRSPPPKRSRLSPLPPSRTESSSGYTNASRVSNPQEDRAARLASMQSNATTMTFDRQRRLAELLEKEKAELEADERARTKSNGMSSFLSNEQKKVFGGSGGLEDRIRRGRGGMVVDAD